MTRIDPHAKRRITRRSLLKAAGLGVAGVALYSGEVERHWIDLTHHDVSLRRLPTAFDGLRVVQISDIHMDEYTEPFFLHRVVDEINRLAPDVVLMTGDFVTHWPASRAFAIHAAGQCAKRLGDLNCRRRYAVLGNHDNDVGAKEVTAALTDNGIHVLVNAHLPLEKDGSRIWICGVDDPGTGRPDPERAIPESIRNQPNESVVLMCHAPDYADQLLTHPAGLAVDWMLSGHTHGGQIRLPLIGAMALPTMGKKYVEGWFRLGAMQLYVNRGIGTVGIPFRFDCPPEITVFTLRQG